MSNIKQQVISGMKWSASAKLFTQVFSWISTFYVIRLLTPEDYGLVALATVFFTLITLVTNNGIINAIVQKKIKDSERRSALFTVSLGMNALLSAAMIGAAEPIASYYENVEIVPVLLFLGVINPLMSLSVIPQAALQTEMRFKARAIVETAAGFIAALVAFTLAHMGFGVWALLISSAAMMTIRIIGLHIAAGATYRCTLNFNGIGNSLKYALQAQLGGIMWFVYNRADTVIIAKGLGVDRAGIYNVASEIASIPMTKINAIINEVAFSAFSKTNDDHNAMVYYLGYALRVMSIFTFPVFAGLSVISEPLVITVLGEKWREASAVILILAWVFPLRMQATVLGNFIMAKGDAKFSLVNAAITCTILLSSITVGVQFGIYGAAYAWVVGFSLAYLCIVLRASRRYNLPIKTFTQWVPVAGVSVVMWCGVYAMQSWLTSAYSIAPWLELAISVITGAIIAGPVLLKLYWKDIKGVVKAH